MIREWGLPGQDPQWDIPGDDDMLRERIVELENAIRVHRESMWGGIRVDCDSDRHLYSMLRDERKR